MKPFLTFLLVAMLWALPLRAPAQIISLTSPGSGIYTQNFDGLGTTSVSGAFSATIGSQTHIGGLTGVSGMNGWHGTKIAGTGSSPTALTANDGSGNSGLIYSYGTGTEADRALGMLASGTNVFAFGALFQNSAGITLDTISLSFIAEFWRSSTSTQNILTFGYGIVDGTTITTSNFLTTGSALTQSSLNITGPNPVTSNSALDGNLASNQATFTDITITGLIVAPGQTFFIRWQDTNDTGNDAGLAIDNLSLSATAVPEPTTWALLTSALMTALILRRHFRSFLSPP